MGELDTKGLEALISQLRRLVDEQEGGDAVVLVQRQLFNRVVGALAASLPTPPVSEEGVAIKELEWEGRALTLGWHVRTILGTYDIWVDQTRPPDAKWFMGPEGNRATWHPSLEAAKAAAQQDFNTRIRSALAATAPSRATPSPEAPRAEATEAWYWVPPHKRYRIEHDGFVGTVIGVYTTLEGKRGVVLQLDNAKVVHVYGEKWLRDEPVTIAQMDEANARIEAMYAAATANREPRP